MVGFLVMLTAAALLVWGVTAGRKRLRNGAGVAFAVGGALFLLEATLPPGYEPGPPAQHGVSSRRVEDECIARIPGHLLAPQSMRFLGNPVDATPYWDADENEWRWIMDVTAENGFGVRVRERFQCVVTAGPRYVVRPVD